MIINWLNLVLEAARQSYKELFIEEPAKTSVVAKDSWKAALKKEGVKSRDRSGVYLVDKIVLREDATYFDVLHELGHDASYLNMGIKNKMLELKKVKNLEELRKLEKRLPLEFIENLANQYARVIGSKMKYKLPGILEESLANYDVDFAAINGSVQREGWGRDIDVWIVAKNPEIFWEMANEGKLPPEWDFETVQTDVFEEDVENANGIYVDLAARGEVVIDRGSYSDKLIGKLETKPSKKEKDYHFRKAHKLLSLAKSRLLELEFYVREDLMKKSGVEEALVNDMKLPVPDLFINPLSYSVSYAHIGKEYSKGNRVIISDVKIPLLEYMRSVKQGNHHPEPARIVEYAEKFLKNAARHSLNVAQ